MRQIASSPYLRLMAALVFLVAIATQWTAFQLSLVADLQFAGDADGADPLLRHLQLHDRHGQLPDSAARHRTGAPPLRDRGDRFAAAVLARLRIRADPALARVLTSVLITNAFDQGFRFSLDKATYELLYLPIPPQQRVPLKNTIDIIVNRIADGCGALLLGLATKGFAFIPGLGLGSARDGNHQPGLHQRVDRRRMAPAA